MSETKKLNPWKFGTVFGLMHFMVDLVTVSTAFAVSRIYHIPIYWGLSVIVLYDVIAFAGQSIIGWFSDAKGAYRVVTLTGLALTALSAPVLLIAPIIGLVLTGIGNAMFHVGAGAMSLRVTPGRATIPGVFVAPGAIGLGLGTLLGKSELYFTWPFVGALAVAFVVAWRMETPAVERPQPLLAISKPTWVIIGLLISIAIRALVGFGGCTYCTKTSAVKWGLMSVAFFGKGLGGLISDRIGWIPGSVGALLISAPFIAFFGANPVMLIIGLLFFQMTMPVTLVAVAEVMPGRPGLAFGLCCLALLAGALLAFSTTVQAIYSSGFFFGAILLSATLVFFSLRHLQQKIPMKF